MLEKIKKNAFVILLVIQPILDIIAYFQYDRPGGTMAGYIRLVIMCALPIYVLCTTKKKKSFLIIMACMAAYCLLHVLNGFRVGYISLFKDVQYIALVMQMPILTVSFIYWLREKPYMEMTKRAFLINLLLIFIANIVAYFTNTGRDTYVDQHVGFTGWFENANSQSIIIVSLIPLALCLLIAMKSKWRPVWMLLGMAGSCFMLIWNGTKAAYFSIFIIFAAYAFYFVVEFCLGLRKKVKLQWIPLALSILVFVGSVLVYPYSPRYQIGHMYDESTAHGQEEIDKIEHPDTSSGSSGSSGSSSSGSEEEQPPSEMLLEYYRKNLSPDLIERFGFERVLAEYGGRPNAVQLSDVRLMKKIYARLVWEETDFITKLVGFEYPQMQTGDENFDLENDPPAILYYYGYLGAALYAVFIAFILFMVTKRLITDFKHTFSMENFILGLTLCLQLGLSIYSGALLRRPNASIYLSVILALCYLQAVRPLAPRQEALPEPAPVQEQ